MKFFLYVGIFLSLVTTSVQAMTSTASEITEEASMTYFIKEKTEGQYDWSSIWSDTLMTATVRTNLILNTINPAIKDKIVGVSKNQPVQIEVINDSDFTKECNNVVALNFEYVPGLPEYLMFFTLKGEKCKTIGEELVNKKVRLKFLGDIIVGTSSKSEQPISLEFQIKPKQ